MKYYNPATRKRPVWEELLPNMRGYIACRCGSVLHTMQIAFEHWQQGHFDEYEEYKEKENKCVDCKKVLWVRERQHLYEEGWRCHNCHVIYCNVVANEQAGGLRKED